MKFLNEADGYKYKNANVLNADKTVAKITDYAVSTVDGEDATQSTFEGAKLLFVIYDVSKASTSNMSTIKELVTALDGKVEMMALTASGSDQFEAFRHEHQFGVSLLHGRCYSSENNC